MGNLRYYEGERMTYGIIKKEDGTTYISPIFAFKYAGWKTEAIIFDETFEKVKKTKKMA